MFFALSMIWMWIHRVFHQSSDVQLIECQRMVFTYWVSEVSVGLSLIMQTEKVLCDNTHVFQILVHFFAVLQNNSVKWPNSRFCGEREHTTVNVSISFLTWMPLLPIWFLGTIVRRFCKSWTSWNNFELGQMKWSYIFRWRLCWRCCRCLSSLITKTGLDMA